MESPKQSDGKPRKFINVKVSSRSKAMGEKVRTLDHTIHGLTRSKHCISFLKSYINKFL